MRHFYFTLILLYSGITCYSQVLSIDQSYGDRERFLKEVKQLDQFFKRFGNREDIFLGELKARDTYLNEKKDIANFQTERKKMILTLLNYSDSTLIKRKETIDFINYAGDDSNHVEIGYNDANWYARVDCSFKFRGQKQNLYLTLKREGSSEAGNKRVIAGVDLPFIDLNPTDTDSLKFIGPMNHELGFMDLYIVFNDKPNVVQYTFTGFSPDQLPIMLYLIKTGELQYVSVNAIQYQFLQVKNWFFTVDYFNRASNNSGWLISSIAPMDDAEKKNYKEHILKITP